MHIETLKVFCDLAEWKSFSKAAEKHLLSQSAISQQLAQIELLYKCQLINRKKRPLELTKEGQLLYIASKDILDRYEQFKSELNAMKSSTSARINVAAIFSIGMHVLPSYVKKFMVKYPQVNVHIEYMEANKIYAQVLSGDIDVGLVAIPKRDRKFEVYEFINEPLVLVCSPRHLLASEKEVDIHQVQFENFICFGCDVPTRGWIDNILSSYNVVVNPTMEFDNTETIKRAVEINSGVTILPKSTIMQEVASGTLMAIPFTNQNFVRPTGIIVRKNKLYSQACKFFIELLRGKKQ
ncbi:MAG TPA: LysR family transcriptional regulator [Sedimentisphaerales bacterium]|nr:LysR family transcriptional regulator [Sedimentisphaerales bacterium]